MSTEKKYYSIGAVDKLCDLIEALSLRDGWELSELSDYLEMPKTTVHRFLLTMADRGYVVQERQRGKYSLSYKLFSVASRVIEKTGLLAIAGPIEERLRDSLGETVNLTVPSGANMLVVDKKVSFQPLRQDVVLGSTFSMARSASGRVYLAYASELDRNRAITALKLSGNQDEVNEVEDVLDRLGGIRRIGIEDDNEGYFEGVCCLACPILDSKNSACASISVSFPISRFTKTLRDKAEIELREAARNISIRLGATII